MVSQSIRVYTETESPNLPKGERYWFMHASWSRWSWCIELSLPFLRFRRYEGEGPAQRRWDAAHPPHFWREFQAEEFERISREHAALGLTSLDGNHA